ncbi:MAG: mechanosensitive ion channel [Rhodocyclaceae bacterium]|nr:mechanosensitive ion channel [Rhodocyclaceae bacterium]MCB1961691.1 mechanosensitive ion channel [Rhodocyclaceae bacterium]
MEPNALWSSLQTTLGAHLPSVFGALAILVVGWMAAVVLRAGVRRLLGATRLNQRLADTVGQAFDVEGGVALGLFWLILLVTLVAVFNTLDLHSVSAPFAALVGQIVGYLPNLFAGLVLALLAWLVATALRALVARTLTATALDDKLSANAGMEPMSKNVANVLFWLVILLFLPAVLASFELQGLLEPVRNMVDAVVAMLPNIFAAVVIAAVGWVVGSVLRALVSNLLSAAGADTLAMCAGVDASVKLSRVAGMLVFVLVFVPSLIAALDALQIDAISGPATEMLDQIFTAVPNIIAAAVILTLTWYVARFGATLVARLLAGVGFDLLPAKLGMAHAFDGDTPASAFVGRVLLFFAMLFGTVEAANRLGFEQVRDVVTLFIQFGADILLGAVILVIGFWLANAAHKAINAASGKDSAGLAAVARGAILGLVLAMGLRAMGIADDIVNLAFGLTLGAVAVALALSFGLGGREAAGRQMEYWLARLRDAPPSKTDDRTR